MQIYQTATSFAISQIKAMIVSMELQPGSRIDQTEMAKRLNIRRIPIRQALAQLAEQNFVILQAHKSAVVAPISAADIKDLYSTRCHLESWAIHLAFPNYTPSIIARLETLSKTTTKASQTQDLEYFMINNRNFHLLLVEPANNKCLHRMIENLYDLSERYQISYLSTHLGMQKSSMGHNNILKTLRADDEKSLVRYAEEHNYKTMSWVLGWIKT
jgi:DNA-binding GntR family transcriptional regulator